MQIGAAVRTHFLSNPEKNVYTLRDRPEDWGLNEFQGSRLSVPDPGGDEVKRLVGNTGKRAEASFPVL